MESRNEYVYVCGTSKQLIENPGREKQYENLEQAQRVLTEIKGEIIVPKFTGVYQGRGLIAKMAEAEKAAEFFATEMLRQRVGTELGIKTAELEGKDGKTLQPIMISVLYDPKQGGIELVSLLFDDPLQRVTNYPIDNVPNFREKDTSLRDLICGNVREIALKEGAYDEQIRMLRANLGMLEQDRRTYGLTIEEWMFLYNSRELWTRNQSDPLQRKIIEVLRKLYKESEKD